MNGNSGTLIFVDYLSTGFKRYAEPIITELNNINSSLRFVAVYMEETNERHLECFDELICASRFNYNPRKVLEKYKPDGVILFAHRFFDYMFTIEAHKNNIPVFNFQHGLYMDSTVISKLSKKSAIQLIKKKKEQIKLYTRCMYYMNHKNISRTFSMFADLFHKHNMYDVMNMRFGESCNADFSFVYGKYWKNYYKEQYKEIKSNYIVVGYPELEGSLKETHCLFNNDLPTVCYLAQTSVEDGIVEECVLRSFLSVIEETIGKINLILKLHPRSNSELYKSLTDKTDNVLIWEYPEFPECDCYIGHESTVVARALYITNKTMVYRLSADRISPFEKYSAFICTDSSFFPEQLSQMIKATKNVDISDELNAYVYRNPSGALKETAQIIYDNIRKGMKP